MHLIDTFNLSNEMLEILINEAIKYKNENSQNLALKNKVVEIGRAHV